MSDDVVTTALKAMKAGTGTFDDVKNAVSGFDFSPLPPPAKTLQGLFDEEEYVVVPGSFRDTVFAAMFDGTLTREQVEELRAIAYQS